jgi:23S rRNA (cytidine2498-2'-O)-methyltransferase
MKSNLFVAISPQNFSHELLAEVSRHSSLRIKLQIEGFFLIDGPFIPLLWAEWLWPQVEVLNFSSISEASRALLDRKKIFSYYPLKNHRRASLISDKIKTPKTKTLAPFQTVNFQNIAAWTLISENELLVCPETNSPFPLGKWQFQEDKSAPSRAYLKLWEMLTRFPLDLPANSVVVDLGACPGGWTWALRQKNWRVLSVDKAPLADGLMKDPAVEWISKDAFTLKAKDFPEVKAVFSDIICYPQRLLELIENWSSPNIEFMGLTIKFKGETDWSTLEKLRTIPGSTIVHLTANKHELTWVWRKT